MGREENGDDVTLVRAKKHSTIILFQYAEGIYCQKNVCDY